MITERPEDNEDVLGVTDEELYPPEENDGADGEDHADEGVAPAPDLTNEADEEDYARIEREDLEELALLFPEVKGKRSITELKNPLRYAALRDLGLTPREAYLATEGVRRSTDNRGHIISRVPASAGGGGALSGKELSAARELFSGLSDREIQRLYKKVTV